MSAPAVDLPGGVAARVPPLALPVGSVRALITLSTLGTVWYLQFQGKEMPPALAETLLLVLGYYFGTRNAATTAPAAADAFAGAPTTSREQNRRDPLFLPRGLIRLLIVVGFGAIGFHLYNDGRLDPQNPPPELALLGGFLGAGVARGGLAAVGRRMAVKVTNWLGHVLASGTLLVVLGYCGVAALGIADWVSDGTAALYAGVVGFYMGKR